MPHVPPRRTRDARTDAAFRTGTQPSGALPDAIVRSSRRKKRKLIDEADAYAAGGDRSATRQGPVGVMRRFEGTGFAPPEHETATITTPTHTAGSARPRMPQTYRAGSTPAVE